MPSGPAELAPSTPTREQTRSAARGAILASAEQHFVTKGYLGANLDEIADGAGYSKGAIYSNFSSKDELFLAVSSARGDRTARPLLDALHAPGTAEHKLAAFSDWLEKISAADTEWILVETEFTLVERRSPRVAERLRERHRETKAAVASVIAEQLATLDITPVVDAETLAETIMALESGLALSHAVDPSVRSRHVLEVFRALVGFDDV